MLCGLPFLAKTALGRHAATEASMHASAVSLRHTLSAAGDRQVPCKWSKCPSPAVNNGTYITAIVIKICNTSRDHYGAIKKDFAFSFQDDLGRMPSLQ